MNKRVSLDKKLAALQASDPYRKWQSLDDERVCILCEKVISGRLVDVWQGSDGAYWLNCPTQAAPGHHATGSFTHIYREREKSIQFLLVNRKYSDCDFLSRDATRVNY